MGVEDILREIRALAPEPEITKEKGRGKEAKGVKREERK